MNKRNLVTVLMVLALGTAVFAKDKESAAPSIFDQTVDKITAREAANMKAFAKFTPIVETYVQGFHADRELGRVPVKDEYFLGRTEISTQLQRDNYMPHQDPGFFDRLVKKAKETTYQRRRGWVPLGFAQMAIIDPKNFDREHYTFTFYNREFLGSVRCLSFNVAPRTKAHGTFQGRIWVEDQGMNIVRFNGTFVRPIDGYVYMHFDSWRVNVNKDNWLPAYIYAEGGQDGPKDDTVYLRSQTRLWGYAHSLADAAQSFANTFTTIKIDEKDAVVNEQMDSSTPLASEKAFARQGENNVLSRLEEAGLLAPASPLSDVLETVVNNLMVTNNLNIDPEIRCRVLLTAPIESFSIGHTIVLSRGLIDALPDEGALAAVLAHELAHISLAHAGADSGFAWADRLMFPDEQTLDKLRILRTDDEEKEADLESVRLLANSPYSDKLQNVGLFLKQMAVIRPTLPNLMHAKLGDSLIDDKKIRLSDIQKSAPELAPKDIHQITALPLGSRVLLDPWSNRVDMNKAHQATVTAAREKMPFSLTPFYPYLSRAKDSAADPAVHVAQPDAAKPEAPKTAATVGSQEGAQ